MKIESVREEVELIKKMGLSTDRKRLMTKKRHLRRLRSCGKYYC